MTNRQRIVHLMGFVSGGVALGLLLCLLPNGRGNTSLGLPMTVWQSPHDFSYWTTSGSWSLSDTWDNLTYRHHNWEVVAVIDLHGVTGNLSLGVVASLIWYAIRRNRSNLPRVGCCSACGYDLTGNTSGICSECGLAASVSRTQASDSVAHLR